MARGEEWAVVVGATGALGGAICRRLRAAGLRVLAVARDGAALEALAARDPGVVACPADIAADASVAPIRRAAAGPVRMVVQAAGLPPAGPVTTVAPGALAAAVSLKVGGLLRLVRAVDQRLAAGSRIVALGGHFGAEPSPQASAAGVTNAALANLVRQLAHAYGPRGVTVHLLAPGPVDTERLRRLAASAAADRGVPVDTVLAEHRQASPLGRLVTAEQVAWAAALLLDPEADALHGSTLALDNGARTGIF
jgi:NAD(P)-dependent dehydrogenase (short-subunit alcohol dehydrogenase family)